MAEAMAAVSFVAAIIEISSFAKRLAARCKDFKSMAGAVPKAFHSINVQLPLVVVSLDNLRILAEHDSLSVDSRSALQSMLDACREEIQSWKSY